MDRLIKFWGQEFSQPPYVHPEDSFYLDENGPFELGLLPQPWVGDLVNAKVFVLLLNPGLSGKEIEIEKENVKFRQALKTNLLGKSPNLFLDGDFHNHPGRLWMETHLKGVASLEVLRRYVALLELVPYHSKDFRAYSLADRLPTCEDMRNFVHLNLAPRARAGELTLIVQRAAKQWGFSPADECENIIVYQGGECRGGYMTANTRGGQAIKRQLATVEAG